MPYLFKNESMKVKIDTKDLYAKLNKRTEGYAVAVRGILNKRIGEIVAMCEGLEIEEDKVFKFADYEDINPQVGKKLRELYSELYQSVRGNIAQEWKYANTWNDEFVKRMFGRKCIEDNRYAKYFAHNKDAMNAFFARKQDGLDLSQRIWKYIGQAKEELELALDLGLGEGLSADELSRAVREYLHEPHKLFRRVRNKHGNLVLSQSAKAYHPGRGEYRSSYRNAERLTRTETNMAYRTADITRWQQMDFIIGYEVKLSKNHPVNDICDELAGKYPKTFVFKGWHPNCRCYIVPILCTEEELEQLTEMILRGENTQGFTPAGIVGDVPDEFKDWIANNTERIEAASSLPYFIKDNYKDGNIAKGFAWIEQDKNVAGLGNFSKLLAKQEIDVDKFTNMQTFTSADFKECSNYVHGDKDYKLCNDVPNTGVQFETVGKLSDKETLADLLQDATFGEDNILKYFTDEQLAELNKVATMAKFTSKADAKFMFALDKDAIDIAIQGDTAQFVGSKYIRTNYGDTYKYAIKNGILSDEKGAMCVVNLPKGSRYLQTLANDEQMAMLLPNAKFKVLSTETKTIVQAGKAREIVQYNMELVDDGSDYVKSLTDVKAQVKSEVVAYNKAKKAANNVLKVAEAWDGVAGVDISDLKDLLDAYPTEDLVKETKALAKAVAKAKKEALKIYEAQPTMWGLTKEFGEDAANAFMTNWQKHMAKKVIYDTDELFLEKVLKKELYYANQNPNKYVTTPKLIHYLEKEIANYEYKITKNQLITEVQHSLDYAATSKSAKLKNMVAELQNMLGGNIGNDELQVKVNAINKEVGRLEAEKAKLLAKKIKDAQSELLAGLDESAYTAERKANALSFTSAEEADNYYRGVAGKAWKAATEDGRKGLYEYTAGSGSMNWGLRGYDRKHWGLVSPNNWTKLQESEIMPFLSKQTGSYTGKRLDTLVKAAEEAISMSTYDKDIWLVRGGSYMELDGILGLKFGTIENLVYAGKDSELLSYVGKVGLERGFTSTGGMGGTGFGGSVKFKVYAPKGTQMIYAEPFSHYGAGSKLKWNGVTKQSYFGYEFEMLINTNYYKRVSSIKRVGNTLEVEVEILNRAKNVNRGG